MRLSALVLAAIGGTLTVLVSEEALAFRNPAHPGPPDFDARRAQPATPERMQVRNRGLERLRGELPATRVDWDELLGTPKSIAVPGRFLTGPDPTGMARGGPAPALVSDEASERTVRAFLERHRELFGHGPEMLDMAKRRRDYVTPHNSLRTVVWEQQLEGIPVWGAVLVAHTTRAGELVSLSSLLLPDPVEAVAAGKPGLNRASAALPGISAAEALVSAVKDLGENVRPELVLPRVATATDAQRSHRLKAVGIRGEADARLVWLPLDRHRLQLCWQIILTPRSMGRMYRFLVDARTGQVWVRHCLTRHLEPASYRVYTGDSPSPFTPGHAAPSAEQPPLRARAFLTLSGLSTNASPNGWIPDGANETRGNNVDAHLDRDADDEPDLPRPQGSPWRVFDFPLDLARDPKSYSDASIVELFYWCNWMHDRLYAMGFTEAAGNLQADNFGRGGLGDDALQADGQDGGGSDNAMISVPPDGIAPRMEMFLYYGPDPTRDSDLDTEVVLHEYTHALSDRMVGGGVGLFTRQSAGLGEGWSDFYPLSLLSEPGDDPDAAYPSGGYLSYLMEGLTENYYFGVRRYPYSTDLGKNPLTFKDIDPMQAEPHAGVPLNPLFQPFDRYAAEEVHCEGEVWCSLLWEARANLVRKHGHAVGNELMLQLATDGMRLAPPNPNFVQARDAILLADLVDQQGKNLADLWSAFAKRGLGWRAISPAFSARGVVESFETPGQLMIHPAAGVEARGPAGGPYLPEAGAFQVVNLGTGPLLWGAGVEKPWLEVSPAGGFVNSVDPPVTVTVWINPAAGFFTAGIYTNAVWFTNLATGSAEQREWVLRVGQPNFLTESFEAWNNDLAYRTITFMPNGSPDFYSVCVEPADELPTDPLGGRLIFVGDDGSCQVELSGTNTVSLFELRTNVFFVGGNGYVTLGGGDSAYIEDLNTHFARPRISMLFHDFDTEEAGGRVGVRELDDRVAVSFLGASEYGMQNESTFQLEWFFDGRIRLTYLRLDALWGIVGLSRGSGLPAGFEPSDFSAAGMCAPALALNIPGQANERDGCLSGAGEVAIAAPRATDLAVSLSSSQPATLEVTNGVVIKAGQTRAPFDLVVKDDLLLNGARWVRVTGAAEGFNQGRAAIVIVDNERASLGLDLPVEINEGATLQGTVTLDKGPEIAVTVHLNSDDPSSVSVPAWVIVPAGRTNVSFELRAVDDARLEPDRQVTIAAQSPGWTEAVAAVRVRGNETASLALALPAAAVASQGRWPNAGVLRLPGTLPTNLVVELVSSDPEALSVPATVTVVNGQLGAPFDLTLFEIGHSTGPRQVTIQASAPGFASASNQLAVFETAGPLAPKNPEPVHLGSNVPALVELSWETSSFETALNGGFEAPDFTGWVITNSGPVQIQLDDGTLVLPGDNNTPVPPFSGERCAVITCGREADAVFYQDVVLPAACRSIRLDWRQCVRQGTVDSGYGTYQVQIRDTNNVVLKQVFYGDLGNFWDSGWRSWSCDLSALTSNQVLRVAYWIQSISGSVSVRLDQVQVQADLPAPVRWDVFLGTEPALGPSNYVGSTTVPRWSPGALNPLTSYYWQVLAVSGSTTPGPVWQFTTRGPDSFEWQPVASPQYLGQPFPVMLQAKDELGRIVTNFSGSVALSGVVDLETNWFSEGFEAGTLNDWIPAEPRFSCEVTTETAARGARSLAISGGCGGSCTGLSHEFPAFRPDRIRFHVRAGDNTIEGGHFSLGDGQTSAIYFYMGADGQMGIYCYSSGRVYWCAAPYQARRWYRVDVNCDWSSRTVALYVDGVLAGNNVPALANVSSLSLLCLYNMADTRTWWDEIEFASGPAPVHVNVSPLQRGIFTNGSWSGQLTVLEPGGPVRLLAESTLGYRGLSTPFQVLPYNDLALSLQAAPLSVTQGQQIEFGFTVSNSGPRAAQAVALTNILPAHAMIAGVVASQGSYVIGGQTVRFDLGEIAGASVATGVVRVLPIACITVTNLALLRAEEIDTWPANNSSLAAAVVLPTVSIADASAVEGNAGITELVFPVTLSAATDREVSVTTEAVSGSAQPGLDFFMAPSRLVFAPGTVSNAVLVQIAGDTVPEPDETFYVRLVPAQNAIPGRLLGCGTILNDDGTPGEVASFAWSAIGPLQQVNEPIPVTITARDSLGLTATNFEGEVFLFATTEPAAIRELAGAGNVGCGWPIRSGTCNQRAELICPASAAGGEGEIISLGFYVTEIPSQTLTNFTVRMKHTNREAFDSSPEWDANDWTIVLRTNWAVTQTGWVTCTFTAPFRYNGCDSLMIDFSCSGGASGPGQGMCRGSSVSGNFAIACGMGPEAGDPLAWTGAWPVAGVWNVVPDLRMGFRSGAEIRLSPDSAGPFVQGVWTGHAAVLDPSTNVTLWAEDGAMHRGAGSPFAVTVYDDLALAMTADPGRVYAGEGVIYYLTLTNTGPAAATGVMVTNLLAPSVRVLSAWTSQGDFENMASGVVFRLGDLARGGEALMRVELALPGIGPYTNRAVACRAEPESYRRNNSAEIVTPVSPPRVILDDLQVVEGDAGAHTIDIPIRLSGPASAPMRVVYYAWSETADLFRDFLLLDGEITFPPGVTETNLSARVWGDTMYEPDEVFLVHAWAVAAESGDLATITILNDDPKPVISISNVSLREGDSGSTNAVFAVSLSAEAGLPISFAYHTADGTALAGSDYRSTAGSLEFPEGVTRREITIPTFGDMLAEPDEVFYLRVTPDTNAVPAAVQGACTILNDDGAIGVLAGFSWSAIASPQYAGEPIAVALAACDQAGNAVTEFNGTVALSGLANEAWSPTIGSESFWTCVPVGCTDHDFRAQVIYGAEEIGGAGAIQSMDLDVVYSTGDVLTNFTIRMKHTPSGVFSAPLVWDNAGWTTVYQSDVQLAAGWTRFALTPPFEYDGTNHLMLDFSFNEAGEYSDAALLGSVQQITNSIFAYTSTNSGDPLNWSGAQPPPQSSNVRPNLRLELVRHTVFPVAPDNTGNFDAGQWTGTLRVPDAATELALLARDNEGHTGVSAPFRVESAVDTDGDGLPDVWECRYFGSVSAPNGGPADDPDNDGASNRSEYLAGTDPADPSSRFCLLSAEVVGNDVVLTFPSIAAKRYGLEATADPASGRWAEIGDPVVGTGRLIRWMLSNAGSSSCGFYRLRLLP